MRSASTILEKIFETLGSLRPMHPEKRARRERERSLQRAYRAICGISLEEVQAMFSRPLDDGAFQSLQGYPEFLDLRDRRMEAVSVKLHLLPDKVSALRDVATLGYNLIGKNTYAGREDGGNRLIFHTYEEFNGICAGISTNDVEVCRRVMSMGLAPPAPWVAFPELAESAFGMMEGNMEYWWLVYWEPYWESLDKDKQESFLAGANNAWQACFWRHAGEGREVFEEMVRSRSDEADRQ